MICLSLTGRTISSDLDILKRHQQWIDLAELRVDLLNPDEQLQVAGFPAQAGAALGRVVPIILTLRRETDGGEFSGNEPDRLRILERAIAAGFRYVDLEEDLRETPGGRELASLASTAGCRVIRSVHDTTGVPPDPAGRIRDLSDGGREVAKLATTPGSTADVRLLLAAADETAGVEKILIGMGPFGTASRILSRRFGSLLTFVSDPDAAQAAPGHLGPREMNELYRFGGINAATRYFAVIGSPIAHSSSPLYHNRRFAADGLNARYVPFLVDDVDSFMSIAETLPLQAFSVTIPHKQSVLAHLAARDETVVATGSCNTVLRDDHHWHGTNTDVPGFTGPLTEALGRPATGLSATVIGAGGASRAVVYALVRLGMRVQVLNRTVERARDLIRELGGGERITAGPLRPTAGMGGDRDVIVQTTSVGMHGNGDPVPWLELNGNELVYDIIYTPPDTPLIRRARAAGCTTVTGDQMFQAQADAQYRLFTRLATV